MLCRRARCFRQPDGHTQGNKSVAVRRLRRKKNSSDVNRVVPTKLFISPQGTRDCHPKPHPVDRLSQNSGLHPGRARSRGRQGRCAIGQIFCTSDQNGRGKKRRRFEFPVDPRATNRSAGVVGVTRTPRYAAPKLGARNARNAEADAARPEITAPTLVHLADKIVGDVRPGAKIVFLINADQCCAPLKKDLRPALPLHHRCSRFEGPRSSRIHVDRYDRGGPAKGTSDGVSAATTPGKPKRPGRALLIQPKNMQFGRPCGT